MASLEDEPGTLIIDVDGTLCPIRRDPVQYEDLIPYAPMVQRLREYQARGYTIMLYTSRNMKTHSGNVGKINKLTAPLLINWLDKWQIPYDEILFGKPWPGKKGFYVDDRAIRPDEFLNMSEQDIHHLLGDK